MNTTTHYHLAGMGQSGAQIGHTFAGDIFSSASQYFGQQAQAAQQQGGLGTGSAIASAVLGVASIIQSFFFQPDDKKLVTTTIVNQAEVISQQNLHEWQVLPPSQKNAGTQQAALQNFDTVWAQVVQACSNPQYGTAGQNCIADRQRGGCHYQVNEQCWNWFVGYRDLIANDPQVQATSPSAALPATALTSLGIDPMLLLIGGGVLLLAVLLEM